MKVCSVEGCERPARCRGWCNMHHLRWWRHGAVSVVLPSRVGIGATRYLHDGYVRLVLYSDHPWYRYAPDRSGRGTCRRAFEHRLVMAEHLGRPLERHETVHHINGVRDDNRIENLQLRNGQHGPGQALCCNECGSTNLVEMEIA